MDVIEELNEVGFQEVVCPDEAIRVRGISRVNQALHRAVRFERSDDPKKGAINWNWQYLPQLSPAHSFIVVHLRCWGPTMGAAELGLFGRSGDCK
jgi:hypothetical protein